MKRLPIISASRELQKLNQYNANDLQKHQQFKKWEIATHHFTNNKLYKKLLGEKMPEKWDDLPIITKKDLQGNIEEMLTSGYKKEDVYIGSTSGSSGHPFYFAKDKFTHALTWAYIRYCYSLFGIGLGDLQARFYGIPFEKKKYAIEKLKDYFLNRVRFTVFDLSDEKLAEFLQLFRTKKFKYLYGYTNSIVLFCRYLNNQQIKLKDICPTLKLCIVTSEVCTDEDKVIIETATGLQVVREYGASELCIIAFENPQGKWYINNKTIMVEQTADGKLLCTSLYNKAFPIIRYEIGDIGEIAFDTDGLPYLTKLLGRTNDNIILPSGKVSPGLTFYYISRSILESSGVLKEFIIRQTAINTFVFDIICEGELSNQIKSDIIKKAEMYLEPGLNIVLNKTQYIKRPVSGKIKHFYSEIKP
jgi:phenylacetate-CoA ligase